MKNLKILNRSSCRLFERRFYELTAKSKFSYHFTDLKNQKIEDTFRTFWLEMFAEIGKKKKYQLSSRKQQTRQESKKSQADRTYQKLKKSTFHCYY